MKAVREKQRPLSMVYTSPPTCYNQDITQTLQDMFKSELQTETIDDATIRNLANSLGTEDKYHEKYVQKLLAASETCQRETEDFANLEMWLFCLSGAHMLAAKEEAERSRIPGSHEEESASSSIGLSEPSAGSQLQALKSKPGLTVQTSPSEADLLKKYKMVFSEELFPEEIPLRPASPIRSDICKPKSARRKAGAERLPSASGAERLPSASGAVLKTKDSANKVGRVASSSRDSNRQTGDINRLPTTADFLRATPPEVLFENYEVGKVYETTIDVQNTSMTMQKCSMRPPKSGIFLVTEGIYPDENGVIAPGLSCKFCVAFHPVSDVDYNDVVQFMSPEGCEPLTVYLKARREHPVLRFPETWDSGHCFLGNEITKTVTAKNHGGPGHFWFAAGKMDGNSVLSTISEHQGKKTDDKPLQVSEFNISPSYFAVSAGEIVNITVLFRPEQIARQAYYVTLICDNTKFSYYTLTGEGVILTANIISCEGKWDLPIPGEEWDLLACYYIQFEKTYPCDRTQRELHIYNKSTFVLNYRWLIAAPRLDKGDPVSNIMENSSFTVFPRQGALYGLTMKTFALEFAPLQVSKYHSVLQFILDGIPGPAIDNNMQYFVFDDAKLSKEKIKDGKSEKKFSIRLLEVDVQGSCEHYDVVLNPPLIEISGAIVPGTTIRKCFELLNNSSKPIFFHWERKCLSNIIDVVPIIGCASEKSSVCIEVMITGTSPGIFREFLHCHVKNMSDTIQLQLDFIVREQQMVIEEGNVSFGTVRVGSKAMEEITLKNMSSVKIKWKLEVTFKSTFAKGDNSIFVFPEEGILAPLKKTKIQVYVHAKSLSTVEAVVELLDVAGNHHSAIPIIFDVINSSVTLASSNYTASEIYRGIPFEVQIALINQTCLPTEFRWGQPEGVNAKSCSITVDPKEGILSGEERKTVNVLCTVNDMTDLHDLRIPCWVSGMIHPVYWSLSGEVIGVEVACAIAYDESQQIHISQRRCIDCHNQLTLNFGEKVELGSVVVRDVILVNKGPHPTYFCAYCTHFTCITRNIILGENIKNNTDICEESEHLLISSFSQRRINALLDEDLEFGRGVSLLAYPYSGILKAYETATVSVFAKADMWGQYHDKLVVQLEDLKPLKIDISLTSIGIPLKFSSETPEQPLVIRFGSYVPGSKFEVYRNFVLENKSAFDIHVDFNTYTLDDDDQQLLDLDVYGQGEDGELSDHDRPNESFEQSYRGPTPLLRLNLTIHEGEPDTTLYHLIPPSLWVKARSQAPLRLCFTPPSVKLDSIMRCFNTTVLQGFLRGLLSLREEALYIPGKVIRHQRHLVQELKADFTAVPAKPELRLDFRNEKEQINFEMEAGEFVVKKVKSITREKSFTATNICNVAVRLRATVASPFHVKHLFLGKPASEERGQIVVQVYEQVEIVVTCSIARKLVNEITGDWPCDVSSLGVTCVETEMGRQLIIRQPLTVQIQDTDYRQVIPVQAVLHLPSFIVSKCSVDFQNCFIGDIFRDEVEILNYSLSSTTWRLTVEGKESHAFRVEPRRGILGKCIAPDIPAKASVDIFFRAKEAIDYNQKITIRGPLRIPSSVVTIKGRGTMDYYYKKQYETVEGNIFNN